MGAISSGGNEVVGAIRTLADDPLETDRVETRYHDHGAPAWLATIKRI